MKWTGNGRLGERARRREKTMLTKKAAITEAAEDGMSVKMKKSVKLNFKQIESITEAGQRERRRWHIDN